MGLGPKTSAKACPWLMGPSVLGGIRTVTQVQIHRPPVIWTGGAFEHPKEARRSVCLTLGGWDPSAVWIWGEPKTGSQGALFHGRGSRPHWSSGCR